MGDKTGIEWTDATWNPVLGCEKVSAGCDHCYAIPMSKRVEASGVAAYDGLTVTTPEGVEWTGLVRELPERLDQPIRWTRPRRIFVNSMSDLFHGDVSRDFQARVFAVMALTPRHTYQVLTKRPSVMRSRLSNPQFFGMVQHHMEALVEAEGSKVDAATRDAVRARNRKWLELTTWPLANVWLGTSVEDQAAADLRIPALLGTPAAVRFLSMEPLLGPTRWLPPAVLNHPGPGVGIGWVIVGGESGPGARPMDPTWVRAIRDDCLQAEVPFHFKQWGEYAPIELEVDPSFAGGRAYNHPLGGRRSATIRERSTKAFTAGVVRDLRTGDQNRGGLVMLSDHHGVVKVGKKAAGRELDGRTWDEWPRG